MMGFICKLALGCMLGLMVVSGAARAGNTDTDDWIDNSLVGNHLQYRATFDQLQQGVRGNDPAKVAATVRYPIKVTIKGKRTTIKSAGVFIRRYADIISPDIASVIKSQKYADVMLNNQGMMLGNGEIWINGICRNQACSKVDVKVITIQHTTQPE